MSVKTPEVDCAQQLATALSLTYGTSVKTGPKRTTTETGNDAVQIWVTTTGGPPPIPYLGGPSTSGSRYEAQVQALVVGAPDDRAGALQLGRQVREAMHLKAPTGYVGSWAQSSDPLPLGTDESSQWMFAMNFRLVWEDTN